MKFMVFKFGGASVNSASGIKNVASILGQSMQESVIVVVSAMGKTTNALEEVQRHYMEGDPIALVEAFNKVKSFHFQILEDLFPVKDHQVYGELESLFDQLRGYIRKGDLYTGHRAYDFEYDQIVSFGELFSSAILFHYLEECGLKVIHRDVRDLIRTDCTYRDARVQWDYTTKLIITQVDQDLGTGTPPAIFLTQGFLGGDGKGNTTTLGREGSDFTAAIFAFALRSTEMTIWKDVPGVMNADPRWIKEAIRIQSLSYREAIELAYYGASIIHPKTIKPLENANIRLRVKSFLDPEGPGTVIENLASWNIDVPIFIRKQHQVLISLSSKDFSFILEDHLSEIFAAFASHRVKVNLMQNSAISFSVCVDGDNQKLPLLFAQLREKFETRYNEGLELITVRHYDQGSVDRLTQGRQVLMEQKSRNTLQIVLAPFSQGITTGKS